MPNPNIDWKQYADQKQTLFTILMESRNGRRVTLDESQREHLDGLLNFLDAHQDEHRPDNWASEHELKRDQDPGHTYAESVEPRLP